jgi:hypothetical protein
MMQRNVTKRLSDAFKGGPNYKVKNAPTPVDIDEVREKSRRMVNANSGWMRRAASHHYKRELESVLFPRKFDLNKSCLLMNAILNMQRQFRQNILRTYVNKPGNFATIIKSLENVVTSHTTLVAQWGHLLFFAATVFLFLWIIFLMHDTNAIYAMRRQITSSIHDVNIGPTYGQEVTQFVSAAAMLNWIDVAVLGKVFSDPVCGNGLCETPSEHRRWTTIEPSAAERALSMKARGYGCAADCGLYPSTSKVGIHLRTDFLTESEATGASWNLCSEYHGICIFDRDQSFTDVEEVYTNCSTNRMLCSRYVPTSATASGFTKRTYNIKRTVQLLDGDWTVKVTAPGKVSVGMDVVTAPGTRRGLKSAGGSSSNSPASTTTITTATLTTASVDRRYVCFSYKDMRLR